MPMNAILRRKIEQSRVSVSSYPKLNVLAARCSTRWPTSRPRPAP